MSTEENPFVDDDGRVFVKREKRAEADFDEGLLLGPLPDAARFRFFPVEYYNRRFLSVN